MKNPFNVLTENLPVNVTQLNMNVAGPFHFSTACWPFGSFSTVYTVSIKPTKLRHTRLVTYDKATYFSWKICPIFQNTIWEGKPALIRQVCSSMFGTSSHHALDASSFSSSLLCTRVSRCSCWMSAWTNVFRLGYPLNSPSPGRDGMKRSAPLNMKQTFLLQRVQ